MYSWNLCPQTHSKLTCSKNSTTQLGPVQVYLLHVFLQDGIVMFAYCALWLLSAILNTAYGASIGNALLGLAAVS